MKSGNEVVGTDRIRLTQAGSANVHVRSPGTGEDVENSGILFIGNEEVTAENGFPLMPGTSIDLVGPNLGEVWCISDTEAQAVRWLAT